MYLSRPEKCFMALINRWFIIGIIITLIIVCGGYFIWQGILNHVCSPAQSYGAIRQFQSLSGNASANDSIACSPSNSNSDLPQNPCIVTKENNSVASNWKIYTNNKIGFTFLYPGTWSKSGEDVNVIDLLGNITEIDINFIDTLSHTSLLIEYHLPPNGTELYRYALSQYDSSRGWYINGGKQIEVAENMAIEAKMTLRVDGKGHPLIPQVSLTLIDFLDKKRNSEIQLQFRTPISTENGQDSLFKKLISTFKFTN
jgi:hypothetical protein